LKLFFDMF